MERLVLLGFAELFVAQKNVAVNDCLHILGEVSTFKDDGHAIKDFPNVQR